MKKTILAVMLFLAAATGFSQKVEVQNASNYLRNEQLGRAIEAADKAIIHEDTKADYKAWFYKGAICLEINNLYKWKNACTIGQTQEEVMATMASFGNKFQPISPVSDKKFKLDDGTKGRKLIYKYGLEYIFDAESHLVTVVDPTENAFADRDFLLEAQESLIKSIELNTEDEDLKQKAKMNIGVIYDNKFNSAVQKYNEKKYIAAAADFESSYDILQLLGTIDSSSLNNANLAYKLAVQDYIDQEKFNEALEVINIAKVKFPQDVDLIINEANIYLALKNNEKTVETLEFLMEVDDQNPTIFFAAGASYDALGNFDKAVETYKKSIALDPEYFDANYNLGALFVNKAAEYQELANALPLEAVDKYNKYKTQMEDYLKLALPYLEKADQVQPDDQYTLSSLKEIYSRLKMYDKVKEINARIAQ